MAQSDFGAHASAIRKILNEEALKFGGTISAEHGIGTLKPKSLIACLSSVERELMQKVRAAVSVESGLNQSVIDL
jgi:FAD/FMN-containing dehydrogenase